MSWQGTLSASAWSYLALVVSQNQPQLFINGVSQLLGQISPAPLSFVVTTFGYPINSFALSYLGAFDEVLLYARALITSEVVAEYSTGVASGNSLVGFWPFIEGEGPSVADTSGFANNAQIAGLTNTSWVLGFVSSALSLNGSNTTYLQLPPSAPTVKETFSFSVWVRL